MVKNNVYAMLGELAIDFSERQLDMLFRKFEQCSNLPLQDELKIIDLMRHLAMSDKRVRAPAAAEAAQPAGHGSAR